jgi:hypothetical protein
LTLTDPPLSPCQKNISPFLCDRTTRNTPDIVHAKKVIKE